MWHGSSKRSFLSETKVSEKSLGNSNSGCNTRKKGQMIETYWNLHPLLFVNVVIHPVELSSLRDVIREW